MPSRARPECDDLSLTRDCDGATLTSQAGNFFATSQARDFFVGGSPSHPRRNLGLWLVATYLRTSHRFPLCKHAGGGGMCGGAWLVISTRSSFWG